MSDLSAGPPVSLGLGGMQPPTGWPRPLRVVLLVLGLASCQANPPPDAATLQRIARDQDRQTRDIRPLLDDLRHRNPRVRRWAIRALGTTGDRRAIDPLLRATSNPDPAVAEAAIFALGLLPGPDRWRSLQRLTAHRAAVVATLRPADVSARTPLARMIASAGVDTAGEEVAGLAALALLRLLGDRLRTPNRAIPANRLSLARDALATGLNRTTDPVAHWRMVYALAHLVVPGTRTLLASIAAGSDHGRWSRLFAIRGLGALPAAGTTRECLLRLLDDSDWRLVHAATSALAQPHRRGLPRYADDRVVRALVSLCRHQDHHVRVHAARLLGGFDRFAAEIVARLDAIMDDLGPAEVAMRGAFLQTRARLRPSTAEPELRTAIQSPDWRLRAAAARGLAFLPAAIALPRLRELVRDPEMPVREAALSTLPNFRHHWPAVQLAIACLAERELATRATLATVLPRLGDARAIPALVRAYHDSRGHDFAQPRQLIVRAAVTLDHATRPTLGSTTEELLRTALKDPQIIVRREAYRHLRHANLPAAWSRAHGTWTPLPGREFPWSFFASRPVVAIKTTRGTIHITLLPDSAPLHCYRFLQCIERGVFRGRLVCAAQGTLRHRIVQSPVVHREDRIGARAWSSGEIRDEINDVPLLAGAVAMPKSDAEHTRGDQFFITRVPTPHLERDASVFGMIRDGWEVLDRLQFGDRIEEVSVLAR